MIRLDLSGSTVANFTAGGGTYEVDVSRGCVTCTAARRMLALGVDPAEEIDVQRDGKRVLIPCKSVGWWAALTVVEDAERGPIFRLLTATEQTHSAKSASRVLDPLEDKIPVTGPSVRGRK